MNERIKELAEQANCLIDGMGYGEGNIENFAELIVRECIQVSGPEDSYTDEWFKAKSDSVAKIKQHFRVKE